MFLGFKNWDLRWFHWDQGFRWLWRPKASAANEYPWSQWIPPLVWIFELPKKRECHRFTVQISLNTVTQNKKNMWGFIWNLILVIFVLKWRCQNISVLQPTHYKNMSCYWNDSSKNECLIDLDFKYHNF